jgi:hypothetical protein
MQKLARNCLLEAKEEILWGSEKMRRPCFIEAVGLPSERIINPVWTTEPHLSGRKKSVSPMASIRLYCKYFDDNKLYLVALMYSLQV